MWHIVTDVARSVVCMCDGQRGKLCKMAESIDMPFGGQTHASPRNHILDGDPDPAWKRAPLRGHAGPL